MTLLSIFGKRKGVDVKKWMSCLLLMVIAAQAPAGASAVEDLFEKSTVKALADRVRTYQIKQGLRFKNQPPGGGPGMVKETDSTEYGSGIFLLAASEMIQLETE